MENILRDVRITFRRLLRNKTYGAIIILSLALGIGVNTAIFGLVNTLLLRPLTIKEVDRVVFALDMRSSDDPFEPSLFNVVAFRNEAHSFSGVGMARNAVFSLLGRERPERIRSAAISSDYLTTLGMEPSRGRLFAPEDDRPEAAPVALVSHGMWQTTLGGDPDIIGRVLNLDNRMYTVVGVMPPGFDLPQNTRLWVPLAINIETVPPEQQSAHNNLLVARLKPGVSFDSASVEAREIAGRLEEAHPQFRKGWGIKLIPLRQQLMGDIDGKIRPTLYLLMAIVGLLLLITCANVASLLLVRSVERGHEIAIQVALGAGQRRLIGQLLTESILLSLIGGAVGLILGRLLSSFLIALRPINFISLKDVFQEVHTDMRVLAFAFGVSLRE